MLFRKVFLCFALLVGNSITSTNADQIEKNKLCNYAYSMSLIDANSAKKVQENINPSDTDSVKDSKWNSYHRYATRAANWAQFYGHICKS
jgi:hypothetical protein